MKKLIFIILFLTTYSFGQKELVRMNNLTDSLNTIRASLALKATLTITDSLAEDIANIADSNFVLTSETTNWDKTSSDDFVKSDTVSTLATQTDISAKLNANLAGYTAYTTPTDADIMIVQKESDNSLGKVELSALPISDLTSQSISSATIGLASSQSVSSLSNELANFKQEMYDSIAVLRALIGNTGNPLPTAPTNLAATGATTDIGLTWTASTDYFDSVAVYRSLSELSGYTVIAYVDSGTNAYTDATASTNILYWYQLRAINSDVYSATSNTDSAFIYQAPAGGGGTEGENGWFVDADATGDNDGSSWANAWNTFGAISWVSMTAGDTLYISGGTDSTVYTETLDIQAGGDVNNLFVIRPGLSTGHNGKVVIRPTVSGRMGIAINVDGRPSIGYIKVEKITVRMMQTTSSSVHGAYINSRGNLINVVYLDSLDIYGSPVGAYGSGTDRFGIMINGGGNAAYGSSRIDSIFIRNCYIENILNTPDIYVQSDGIFSQNAGNIYIMNSTVIVNNDIEGRSDASHNDCVQLNLYNSNITIANSEFRNTQDVNTCSGVIICDGIYGYLRMYNNILAAPFFGWTNGEWPCVFAFYTQASSVTVELYHNVFEAGSTTTQNIINQNTNAPNWIMKNNIFMAYDGTANNKIDFRNSDPTWANIDGNLWTTLVTGSGNVILDGRTMATLKTLGAETLDGTELSGGTDRYGVLASGLFVDYVNYDYHIASNVLGVTLKSGWDDAPNVLLYDKDGVLRTSGQYTIGAYQYVAP